MATKKHLLHELLQEDQEPFLVQNYIADKRLQLSKKSHLHLKNCFLSTFANSPDPRKSPLFNFQSPIKSPIRTPTPIFVPSKTASLLVDAALRIQKKKQVKNSSRFGLFGSFLKRLKHRNENRKQENISEVSVKDILRWDSSVGRRRKSRRDRDDNSVVWSERSLDCDTDTSTSSSISHFDEQLSFGGGIINRVRDFNEHDKQFCESPFHFVLRQSPISSGRRTPDFSSSPAMSPCRFNVQGKENINTTNYGDNELNCKYKEMKNQEEEEEKEQLSPVSVLDPIFEDNNYPDDADGDDDDDRSEDNAFDQNCSFAIVQRTKKHLLHKLRRFEKLAGLDPVELEKRMLEQDQDVDDSDNYEVDVDEEFVGDELVSSNDSIGLFVIEKLTSRSGLHYQTKIPGDMNKLVLDLINEERKEQNLSIDEESIAKRVSDRFELWKEVELNTIDMMVEQDYKRELDQWKRNEIQVNETGIEIEIGIFGLLMEELWQELIQHH